MLETLFHPEGTIIVTGATGLVGRAIAETLSEETAASLVLPVRGVASALRLLQSWDGAEPPLVLPMDFQQDPVSAADQLRACGVTAIVHAAGCCHYTDEVELNRGNQQLTQFWLSVGRELGVQRFVYISTAFCSGSRNEVIPETLHDHDLGEDLTPYMRSKRETEHLIAASGLPYVILRPSILIGDSRTGVYTGKLYGLYQLWGAAHRWLTPEDTRVVGAVLSNMGSLPILHLDMFLHVFLGAFRHLPDNSVMHIVSPDTDALSVRDFAELWGRSAVVSPLPGKQRSAESRFRMWAKHSRVNLEISQHRWQFEHGWLDRLAPVLEVQPYVSADTILTCQDWFRRQCLQQQGAQEQLLKMAGTSSISS